MPSALASEKGTLTSKIRATNNEDDNRRRQGFDAASESAKVRRNDGTPTRTAPVHTRDLPWYCTDSRLDTTDGEI